jgi:hypothetical protein
MEKLEEILQQYGITLYDSEGNERTFIVVLDEIYLKLNRTQLIEFMSKVEQNANEIFADIHWRI